MWSLTCGFCSCEAVSGTHWPAQVVLACVDHGSLRFREDRGAGLRSQISMLAHRESPADAVSGICVRLTPLAVTVDSPAPGCNCGCDMTCRVVPGRSYRPEPTARERLRDLKVRAAFSTRQPFGPLLSSHARKEDHRPVADHRDGQLGSGSHQLGPARLYRVR